jgi:hypothetical protein
MLDAEQQPRNEGGEFTTSEPKFGRAAELEAAGFSEMPDRPEEQPKTYGGDDASLRDAADDLVSARIEQEPQTVERFYQRPDGERIDLKETVTAERAARDLSAYRADVSRYIEGTEVSALADVIDSARAEVLKNRPQDAETYGFDPKEVEANAAKLEAPKADEVSADASPAEPVVEGLDPEVQKALKLPQVRQAIEEELGRADTTRQQYAGALSVAHQVAQATFSELLPELQMVPQEKWPDAIGILHQTDPQRVQRAMAVLERGSQIEAAQGQLQQQQAAHQRQQFETYAKAEDRRFEELTKSRPVTRAESDAIVAYAKELGIEPNVLVDTMRTNPVMRHAAFQKMMLDAARYRLMQKATPKAIPKSVPPVQRPGTSGARQSQAADDVQALTRTFRSSGDINDAVRLLAARRAARG